MPGMGELGISPHSIEEILQDILKKPPIEKKPKQDLDCGKADYATPPRLTGMSAKLDRAITQGDRASVVVEQRPLQPRASPVGIASAVVVAIRRSAVTTGLVRLPGRQRCTAEAPAACVSCALASPPS
jgi:hypothetical protein